MNHSRNPNNFSKLFFIGLLLLLFTGITTETRAQMFTVEGERSSSIDIPGTGVYLGVEPAQFNFRGTGEGRFEFKGTVLRLLFETPDLQLFFATGGSLTGIEEISFLNVGVQAGYGLTILRQERLIIQLPLRVKSGITSVVADQSLGNNSQFNQGSLTGGAGGFVAVRPSQGIRIHAGFTPYYGFSFATGGTFGGSLASAQGKLRFFVDEVFGRIGLSVGYNYSFDRFDIEENTFDYDLRSHTFLVGITY